MHMIQYSFHSVLKTYKIFEKQNWFRVILELCFNLSLNICVNSYDVLRKLSIE